MTFVNERVSPENIDRYGLREINRKNFLSDVGYDWTVDLERGIYLRFIKSGRTADDCNVSLFNFYWNSHLFYLTIESVHDDSIKKNEKRWRLLSESPFPKEFGKARKEMRADLKEALTVYNDAGVYTREPFEKISFTF